MVGLNLMDKKKMVVGQKGQINQISQGADSVKEVEKKKLQNFYSSVLGSNPEEVKTNARTMRRKIYLFGLFVLIAAFLLYFLVIGRISLIGL
tara:strand:- start:181 stop:456 length:276 start_codon:yes stop_codon:yes gene_type:complete